MRQESGIEKRKFNRISSKDIAVSYKLYNTQTLPMYQDETEEEVKNISSGGIAFKTNRLLASDTPVSLNIRLGKSLPIKTFGRVAWSNPVQAIPQNNVGVRFSWWLSEDDKRTLSNYINKQISKDKT